MATGIPKILLNPTRNRTSNLAENSRTSKGLNNKNATFINSYSCKSSVHSISSYFGNFHNFGLLPSVQKNSLAESLQRTRGNHYYEFYIYKFRMWSNPVNLHFECGGLWPW